MGKELKFMNHEGREISKDELGKMVNWIYNSPKVTPSPTQPPGTLREFEDRLMKFYLDFDERFFGIAHDICQRKISRSSKTALRLLEELGDQKLMMNRSLDLYSFLREILEQDISLFGQDYYLLGLHRDLSQSEISKPIQREIGIRVAAQILWENERLNIPSVSAMARWLLREDDMFYNILNLHGLKKREIENKVRLLFPIPSTERNEKNVKEKYWLGLVDIPDIWSPKGLSFPRLRCALQWFAVILKQQGWEVERILKSVFVEKLSSRICWYSRCYVDDWIRDGYKEATGHFFQ